MLPGGKNKCTVVGTVLLPDSSRQVQMCGKILIFLSACKHRLAFCLIHTGMPLRFDQSVINHISPKDHLCIGIWCGLSFCLFAYSDVRPFAFNKSYFHIDVTEFHTFRRQSLHPTASYCPMCYGDISESHLYLGGAKSALSLVGNWVGKIHKISTSHMVVSFMDTPLLCG